MPDLPRKNYITFIIGKSQEKIELRQKALDAYLRYLVDQPSILHSQPIREFLELAEFSKPDLVCTFEGFTHGIKDFTVDFDRGMMFMLSSDGSVLGRVDAYLNKRTAKFSVFMS